MDGTEVYTSFLNVIAEQNPGSATAATGAFPFVFNKTTAIGGSQSIANVVLQGLEVGGDLVAVRHGLERLDHKGRQEDV
jgi:hypothetical protein